MTEGLLNTGVSRRLTKWVVPGLFIFLYVPFLYHHAYQKAFISNGDFPSIYWGAKIAFVDRRSPYVAGAFAEAESSLRQHCFPYLYPPTSLLMFYPFTLVSYQAAKLLMLVVSHLCILIFIYLFFFKIRPLNLQPISRALVSALSIIYVLMFYPVVDNLLWGQINLLVLTLICLAWYALKNGASELGIALPLSLAILLKTYPLLLLPLLIIKKKYRAVVLVLTLLAFYTLISWLVLPESLWGDWLANVLPSGGYGRVPFNLFLPVAPWNHSVNGFGTFIQDRYPEILWLPAQALTRPLSYLLSSFLFCGTVLLSYQFSRKSNGEGEIDLEFSIFLLMIFLVAPLSWEHHLVYVLPSALIGIHLLLFRTMRRTFRIIFVVALFVIAWEFPRDDMFFLKGALAFINPVKFYAVLAVWIFFALHVRGQARADSSSEYAVDSI